MNRLAGDIIHILWTRFVPWKCGVSDDQEERDFRMPFGCMSVQQGDGMG